MEPSKELRYSAVPKQSHPLLARTSGRLPPPPRRSTAHAASVTCSRQAPAPLIFCIEGPLPASGFFEQAQRGLQPARAHILTAAAGLALHRRRLLSEHATGGDASGPAASGTGSTGGALRSLQRIPQRGPGCRARGACRHTPEARPHRACTPARLPGGVGLALPVLAACIEQRGEKRSAAQVETTAASAVVALRRGTGA